MTSMNKSKLKEGSLVLIKAFDDAPEHRFRVTDVWDDVFGGVALDGPLKSSYGEPCYAQIGKVLS